jgi:hypothetical protein
MSNSEVYFLYGGCRSPSLARAEWSSVRRSQYLLRTVDVPISFDKRVLPLATPGEVRGDDFELVVSVVQTEGTELAVSSWSSGERLDGLPGSATVWTSAGFDICDELGYSGLMNCSYDPPEHGRLAARWAAQLNEHHLFDRLEHADEFRKLADLRVPAHAPFLVLRLYRQR